MSDDVEHMLTTIDNPFDPFDQFDAWFEYDRSLGYDSCSLLARVAQSSSALSDKDENFLIEQAMQEIVDNDPLGVYVKVSKSVVKSDTQETEDSPG